LYQLSSATATKYIHIYIKILYILHDDYLWYNDYTCYIIYLYQREIQNLLTFKDSGSSACLMFFACCCTHISIMFENVLWGDLFCCCIDHDPLIWCERWKFLPMNSSIIQTIERACRSCFSPPSPYLSHTHC